MHFSAISADSNEASQRRDEWARDEVVQLDGLIADFVKRKRVANNNLNLPAHWVRIALRGGIHAENGTTTKTDRRNKRLASRKG